MNILHRDDDAELAVDLNDIAFSERAGDDFHGYLDVLPLNKGRTIAILSPIATYFLSSPRTRTCRKPRPPPRPSGLPTSTPTGGRHCWRAAASWRRCAPGLRRGISSRSRPAPCRFPRATRRICMPSPPRSWRRTARRRGFICAPRRNSPARNSWPPGSAASSNSPRCFATGSAERCIIRNSRWSNGIAPASPTGR